MGGPVQRKLELRNLYGERERHVSSSTPSPRVQQNEAQSSSEFFAAKEPQETLRCLLYRSKKDHEFPTQ